MLMDTFTGIVADVEQKYVSAKAGKSTDKWHIAAEDIAAFVEGKILAGKRSAIIRHIAFCAPCRKSISQVLLSQSAVKDPVVK